MSERVVLRFSDYEYDTIREHLSVLHQSNVVWWGWWKKMHEPERVQEFRRLAELVRTSPIDVGLVNRDRGIYFRAACDRIEFDAQSIPTPMPEATPKYYWERKCFAWFRFLRIEEVDNRSSWERQFGASPDSEWTVFFRETPRERRVPHYQGAVRSGRGLLHISDIHFGTDHRFRKPIVGGNSALLDKILRVVKERPAGIIVSGDVTTRAEAPGFREALDFLRELSAELEVAKERVVIVPGNHDIAITDSPTNDFGIEALFREFLREFYGESQELERIHEFWGADDIHYVLATVNSSHPRTKATMNFGYVGEDRSRPVLQDVSRLCKSDPARSWGFLVMHHHVLMGADEEELFGSIDDVPPVSVTLDGGSLVSMCGQYGIDAILRGHQHLPFVGKVARIAECPSGDGHEVGCERSVIELAAGSLGATQERLDDLMDRNSFSFYDFRPNEMRIRAFEFNTKIEPRLRDGWDFWVRRRPDSGMEAVQQPGSSYARAPRQVD